jgi:3-(3-hydroxy-phenyl)propionate hydroxylase
MAGACVVIGAGPVGLTAALALRRRGVEVLVLDAEPAERPRPGSRAIFLMQPTLRRFEQVLPGLGASIAADGARSVARSSLGLELEGKRDDTPFIIVDVDEHPDGSTPRMPARFCYRFPQLDGRNVMHMPFAGGMRVDLQCLPSDDAEYLASPAGVREWLAEVVDPWYAEHVNWVSTYRFHQSVARSYTDDHNRVLLAGEAAHLFAPWGGRGLNSGVFDATDAAAAVAGALDDPASARRLIARCAADRRKWGLHNRDVSSRALRRMRAADPVTQLQRQWAARLAPFVWPAGAWLANGPTQLPVPRPASLTTVGWY